jgi:hypothetical protein
MCRSSAFVGQRQVESAKACTTPQYDTRALLAAVMTLSIQSK